MKKKWVPFLILGIVGVALILAYTIYHTTKEKNAMEQIYIAATTGGIEDFNRVTELERISEEDIADFENFGGLSVPYKQEYLKENFEIELFFPTAGKNIEINSNVTIADNVLVNIHMTYRGDEKTMTFDPIHISAWTEGELGKHFYDAKTVRQYLDTYHISDQDIQDWQHYILYDVVMGTWAKANDQRITTPYNLEKLVDNTFNFSEQ